VRLREFALHVVSTPSVEEKLRDPPAALRDDDPGPPLRAKRPGRAPELEIVRAPDATVPSLEGYHDPAQRRRILHAFANHELQAVELFAWALLAFPSAPPEFRRGLLRILAEEQRHTKMYLARLEGLGARFGDYPVSGYFWNKTPGITTPLAFVCAMSLTFENANLDHTTATAAVMRRFGDEKSARVVEQIHRDEVGHVRFGWEWLARLKPPGQTMWEAYLANVSWPLRPALARGRVFCRDGREAAGLDPEFIDQLAASDRDAGEG
jgi:uncharacterized ferritin-like protein (DUF455 family)